MDVEIAYNISAYDLNKTINYVSIAACYGCTLCKTWFLMIDKVFQSHKLTSRFIVVQFLDAQRIHNLTKYLQALHKQQQATEEHTTLLLNCYTKLKDVNKLDEFIMVLTILQVILSLWIHWWTYHGLSHISDNLHVFSSCKYEFFEKFIMILITLQFVMLLW